LIIREQIANQVDICAEDMELQYGIRTLMDEEFVAEAGILDEGVISVHMSLDGGKRKKKKKPHTTPKKIPHKHKKRPKAFLEFFSVDDATGKVQRLKQESSNHAGVYMADHPDRYTCGKSHIHFWKLTEKGQRLPHPKQNSKVVAEKVVVKKEAAKKKGKK
jgi:small subunit ribosomal protein S27Ae